MSLLKELVQQKYIVQKEQYILVIQVPVWYESIQEKLGKVRN